MNMANHNFVTGEKQDRQDKKTGYKHIRIMKKIKRLKKKN